MSIVHVGSIISTQFHSQDMCPKDLHLFTHLFGKTDGETTRNALFVYKIATG